MTYRRGGPLIWMSAGHGPGDPPGAANQLGLAVEDVQPFGLAGSADPLHIKVARDPDRRLFGKLYARTHLRPTAGTSSAGSLYGRLEDEKPFHTCAGWCSRRTLTGAIHVYDGDITRRPGRSEWDDDSGEEVDYDFERTRQYFDSSQASPTTA